MPIVDNEDERDIVLCLAIAHEVIAGVPCTVARPSGCAPVSEALTGVPCGARPSSCTSAFEVLTGASCTVARLNGGASVPGALVVLDGTRVLRRVDRLVAEGKLDPVCLPLMVGIDPDPADRGLAQYLEIYQTAYDRYLAG